MRFARECLPFVLPLAAAALACAMIAGLGHYAWTWGAVVFGLLGAGILLFFRDPERYPPAGETLVVSPADGKILVVETLSDGRRRVAIFLSVFNVHVNRAPIAGVILSTERRPGKYFHAGSLSGAEQNARVEIAAETKFGQVAWTQVSGYIARKIACRIQPGDRVDIGQRFGLIYFGSRMEVLLPSLASIEVKVGQRVRAGESVIAIFGSSKEDIA